MFSPEEILTQSIAKGTAKTQRSLFTKFLLGMIGGALIGISFLANVRVSASIPASLGSVATLVGATVFPIGLVMICLAGGELATGNMMTISTAMYAKKISIGKYVVNLLEITLANLVGAILVAYFFGHFVGLTHVGVFKTTLITMAQSKVTASFWQSFVSGIGCNWLVGLAVWMSFGAKDAAGKILGVWFPTMIFVAAGFQHSIANCFLIPAAVFEGGATWGQFISNLIPVYLGNIVGGAIIVGAVYYLSFKAKATK